MRKNRNLVAIGGVGKYLQEERELLLKAQLKLIQDSNSILEADYQGIDANMIVAKLVEAGNKINDMINCIDYFSSYMLNVAKYDRENINNTNKRLTPFINDIVASQTTNDAVIREDESLILDVNDNNKNGGDYNA